jgi:hypothetical protein
MKLNDILVEGLGFEDTSAMIEALGDHPEQLEELYLMGHWKEVRDFLLKNFDFRYYGINPKNVDWYEVVSALGDEFIDDTEEMISLADSDMDQFDL